MKKKLFLLKTKYSFLFYDCLSFIVGEKWNELRKESNIFYRLIKATYKK